MEIFEGLSAGSSDVSVVLKGKRTKRRQRPLSPVGCRVAGMTSSSSSGGGGGEDGEVVGYFVTNSMSTDISATSTTTHQEDDQDIANCLILLAQGERGRKQVKTIDHHHHHHEEQDQNHQNMKMQKFSSKKLNETGDKAGVFVYECKTCNRTFPSFQALGGHRASHKKPKITEDDKKAAVAATAIPPPPPPPAPATDVEELVPKEEHGGQLELSGTFLEIKANGTNHKAKNHHHECSICGAEFSSGQALGGHMRRHRNPPPRLPPLSGVSTFKVSMVNVNDELPEKQNPRKNIFTFDLNLPAPEEEEIHVHRDLKFQQQQHHLAFSAPALVGCHY